MTTATKYNFMIPEKYQNSEGLQQIRTLAAGAPYTLALVQTTPLGGVFTCAHTGDLDRIIERSTPIELRMLENKGQEGAKKLWERLLDALKE